MLGRIRYSRRGRAVGAEVWRNGVLTVGCQKSGVLPAKHGFRGREPDFWRPTRRRSRWSSFATSSVTTTPTEFPRPVGRASFSSGPRTPPRSGAAPSQSRSSRSGAPELAGGNARRDRRGCVTLSRNGLWRPSRPPRESAHAEPRIERRPARTKEEVTLLDAEQRAPRSSPVHPDPEVALLLRLAAAGCAEVQLLQPHVPPAALR